MLNSAMAKSEQQFIDLCKKQVAEKFSFGNGHGYTQRDLEVLSTYIEERTGIIISLSTLKRLWKDNYKLRPQLATLNALALILEYKDWQSFKQANQVSPKPTLRIGKWALLLVIAITIVGMVVLGSSLESLKTEKEKKLRKTPTISGPVYFDAQKTVAAGIPNTVIFKYDVSNVVADTFYIQQSWNEDHKVKIDPKGKALSSIYFESGYHRAKLLANDSVISQQAVHIISNGWEPHIYRSDSEPELVDLKNEKFITNGMLHLDSNILVKRNVDFSKQFHSRITNSQIFDVHSDNFSFHTRMKADRVLEDLCAWMDLIVVTEVQTFMISWTEKGCEKNAAYKLGEILRKGENTDLSQLGCNVYEWQELELRVKDRHAMIYLNGKLSYQEVYKQNFGKIVSLIYLFDGTGTIDYAKLIDGNGKVTFEENFER
jgi:hypothetical protein